jgi:hypothetical protein
MFRSISDNPHQPAGKHTSEVSRKMISTQYTLGRPEWQDKWQSFTAARFSQVSLNHE